MTRDPGVAPDGSPVALYAALGPHDAVDLVIDQAPAGGSVLDLGCGAGRLAAPLAEAGLDVTGVDNHAEMLAAVPTTVTSVHADIAGLDLGRRFDVVVLASHLVNHPHLGGDFLATCRRHVAADGVVLVERFAPDLLAHLDAREGAYDGIRVRHELVSHDGDHFTARAHYSVAGTTWIQPYEAVLLGDDDFDVALGAAGLGLWDWVDEDRRWACAVRIQD
ncbi:MAG TPA: class I SAM-dependent methyltransferase [Nitriliruptoraceae bacterium]|nr:class I SAM-dependent methyltransferase [Nitriliruptoraceae bacterium]